MTFRRNPRPCFSLAVYLLRVFLSFLHLVSCHQGHLFFSSVFKYSLLFSFLQNIPVENWGGILPVFLVRNDYVFGRRQSGGAELLPSELVDWRLNRCHYGLTTPCFLTLGLPRTCGSHLILITPQDSHPPCLHS